MAGWMNQVAASFVACAACLALPALADDSIELHMKSGESFRGKIVSVQGGLVELALEGKGAAISLPVGDLEPLSVQIVFEHLRSNIRPGNAGDRLALARFCLEYGLWLEAQAQFRAAAELDPSLAETAREGTLRAGSRMADALADQSVSLLEAGEAVKALELLEKLLAAHPDSAAAARVRPLLDAVREKAAAEKKRKEAEAAANGGGPGLAPGPGGEADPRIAQALDSIEKDLAEADRLFLQGVELEGRSQVGRAVQSYAAAEKIQEGLDSRLDALDAAAKSGKLDPVPQGHERLAALRAHARKSAVQLYLALAHHYASTRQLQQGKAYVNRALAIDPENEEALELRQTITEEMIRGGSR